MAESDVIRILASLLVILALIFFLAWLVRRLGMARPGVKHPIRIIGVQSLGQRAQVAMVEVGDKTLVLGVTAHQVTLLDSLPKASDEESSNDVHAPTFAKSLKAIVQRSS